MKFRRRREESLDNEILDYIDRETQTNIEAGMLPAEARHAALRKLGRPILNVKEETRAVWGWVWLERLWQDLHHGCRMLANNPGFTLVAVVSLGIGIGANSAIFSFADALLLRPLPVPRPGEVVTVDSSSPNDRIQGFALSGMSYRDYLDIRDHSTSFDGLVAFNVATFGFATRPDALPNMTLGMLVTGNFFRVMGVEPELGRAFRLDEDQVPGRDAVVILSHNAWQNRFASDPSLIGRRVRLNGIEFVVIGVAPDRFTGMDQFNQPAFYVPMMMWPRLASNPQDHLLEARDQRDLTVKGRLKPGVTMAQAQAELAVIAGNLQKTYPDTNRNRGVTVHTELEQRIEQSPPNAALVAMLGVLAASVLLVACANVAGLMLSRATVRAREIAVRLAIGAGRPRLIRQLLTESLLVALAGGLLGLAVGYGGVIFLSRIQIPTDLPTAFSIQLDQRALFFSLAVSLVSVLLFGLAPALQTTRTDLVSALKSAEAVTRRRRLWGRNLLVAGQVAVSLVLLAVATFMFRGFHEELAAGPGFRTDHLLMMSFDPSLVHYSEADAQQFFRQVAQRARSVPGVKSIALTFSIPMGGASLDTARIVPEGYQLPSGKENIYLLANSVDEHYFDTMGVRIVRGRGFRDTDTAGSPRVAVVNEELAQRYWPGQQAIGKRFRLDDSKGPWVEIVGVAKTGKYIWVAEGPTEFLYLPLAQRPKPRMTLLAESFGDPAALAAPLREAVRGLDANQPIYDVRTMQDFYEHGTLGTANTIIQAVAIMGLMGLVLAMIGLYGLVAYAASRRTREIGIRMAIGAHRGTVLRMVMQQGLVLALSGLAVGLTATIGAERALAAIFAGGGNDSGIDFATYLLVAPALLAITMLAAYIPARRASRVDPTRALRYE